MEKIKDKGECIMSNEVMDKKWKDQMKSKGGFMVRVILGCILTVIFLNVFWWCVYYCAEYNDDFAASIPLSFFALAGSMFCLIFGSANVGRVRRHNKRIERLYMEEYNAKKTATAMGNVMVQASALQHLQD